MKRLTQQRLQAKQPTTFKPTLSVIAASVALALAHAPAASETISGAVTATQEVAAGDDLTVTANGSIKVTETGTAPNAVAVDIAADYTAMFFNQGDISATATATSGTANATAVNFLGAVDGGEIVNSGSITATATGGTTGTPYVGAVVARGIYVNGDMQAGTVFTGTGDITVNATGGNAVSAVSVNTSVQNTYGIFVEDQTLNTSFSQSGDVSLTAVGGNAIVGDASAETLVKDVAGISFDGSVRASTIDISGDVTVNAQSGHSTTEQSSNSRVQQVAGVFLRTLSAGSSFTNSGTVSVSAVAGNGASNESSDLFVEDIGAIFINQLTDSNFNNSGELRVIAKSGTEAEGSSGKSSAVIENVAGILFDRGDINNNASLTNSGNISVLSESGATTGNSFVRFIGGIQLEDITNGSSLNNSGNISVTAISTQGGTRAYTNTVAGISLLQGGVFGNSSFDSVDADYAELVNSGNISVTAQAGQSTASDNYDSADASALNTAGIWVDYSARSGNIVNSGDFSISSTGGMATGGTDGNANADASTFGIRVSDLLTNVARPNTGSTLLNSGNILVTAAAGTAVASGTGEASASASAYGIRVQNQITDDSTVINSGNITALATSGSATGATSSQTANAYAIYVGSIINSTIGYGDFEGEVTTGSLTSTGNLTGRAFGEEGIGAGLYVNGAMDGDVTLQGVIRGVGPTQTKEDSYAIYFGSGTGSLAVNAPTWFVGSLTMADQDVTLTSGKSHSVHWKFDYDEGASFDLKQGDGVPWFSRNGDTQSGEYATYDPSGQALQDQVVASVARFGDHHMNRHLQAHTAGQGKAQSAWAYVGHSHNDFDGKASAVNDFDVRSTGVVGGLVMNTEHDLTLGLMGGAVTTRGQADGAHINTQKLDASSAFVGASLGKNLDGLMLQGGLKLGYTDMDGTRLVNYNLAIPQDGLEQAKGDISARWTAASVGASYTWTLSDGLSITPSAHLSYVHAKLGGYSESGATANATLGGRSLRLINSDMGVQLTKQLDNGVLRGSLAYVSTKASGPATVNVGLIGDTQAVALQRASYSAPKLGLGYTYTPRKNLTVNLDGSALLGSSYKGADISARLNWKF